MGTKLNPGQFDCYAAAAHDEPMFVLLGRDRHAAVLTNLWALMRAAEGEDPAKVREAGECANDMVAYLNHVKPHVTPAGVRAALDAVIQLAQDCGVVVTVEQIPLKPLAMGHYQHGVTLRAARTPA